MNKDEEPRAVAAGHLCQDRVAFAGLLRWWLDETSEQTIGDANAYGGKAWLWVSVGGVRCHLNADTKRAGVRRYLDLVRVHGDNLPWHVVANNRHRVNKVVIGPGKEAIPGFYLYIRPELAGPTEL